MNNQDEGNWNGGNFRIYIAQITEKMHSRNLPSPFGMIRLLVPPSRTSPHEFAQRSLSSPLKVPHALGGETQGLQCMQVDVHNILFSWHAMFEEININFMNPHDNEVMQRNYAKMQKKISILKKIFFS